MNDLDYQTFSDIPLGHMINNLEKWLQINNSKRGKSDDESRLLARGFLSKLLEKIETLENDKRVKKTENFRNRIVNVCRELQDIIEGYSSKVIITSDSFNGRTATFLMNYGFMRCNSLRDIYDYVNSPKTHEEKWNNIKFNAFLIHLSNIEATEAEKINFLCSFLNKDDIKSYRWVNENYIFVTRLISASDSGVKGEELKRLINTLPGVQSDRRKGNEKDENDVWNILYYQKMKVSSGRDKSPMARMPEMMSQTRAANK